MWRPPVMVVVVVVVAMYCFVSCKDGGVPLAHRKCVSNIHTLHM